MRARCTGAGLLALLLSTPLLLAPTLPAPLDKDWIYLGNDYGVEMYWKVKPPVTSSGAETALLRFINTNGYPVRVSYTPTFTCNGSYDQTDTRAGVTIRAGATKSGSYDGLWHIPCQPGERITYLNISYDVERQ